MSSARTSAWGDSEQAPGVEQLYCDAPDVALLYRLALEKAKPGTIYHAVDEEGVPMKAIAEALGRGLKVPVVSITPDEAEAHFGWLTMFMGQDLSASSAITREKLNCKPTGPGLIADLDGMNYAQA